MRIPILALLLLASAPCLIQAQDAPQIDFHRDMQTQNGFSAALCLNSNKRIFEEIVPNPTHLVPVTVVERGEPFYTVVLFANAALKDGRTDITYDITIKRPDGTYYGGRKGLLGWISLQPATAGLVHIADGTLTIKIDPPDPAGKYTVEADVRDNARKTSIHLKQSFEVPE